MPKLKARETVFLPNERVIPAGALVDPKDPVVAGREHLFCPEDTVVGFKSFGPEPTPPPPPAASHRRAAAKTPGGLNG